MLKLGRGTKVKVLFLVLVFVFNFGLFKFSAAILEKGLLTVIIKMVNSSFVSALHNFPELLQVFRLNVTTVSTYV